jgi:Cof subfamily protein (haloacid dehalogenase superfamily)
MNNPIRAVLFDCDGTLAPVHMQVTIAVRDSVKKLSSLVPVAIISSRDFHDISWLAKDLGLTAPQISEGGARLFDAQSNKCLSLQCLEIPDAEDIFKLLEKESLEFMAVDEDKRISTVKQIVDWKISRITATSLTEKQASEIISDMNNRTLLHAAKIQRTDNKEWMIDFTHTHGNKLAAASKFANLLNLSLSDLAAAGDGYNDVSMLKGCGYGIAMGQSPKELHDVADYVAPSVKKDGLAVAIEEFILPKILNNFPTNSKQN